MAIRMIATIYGVLLSITLHGSPSVTHTRIESDTVKLTARQAKSLKQDTLGKYLTVNRIVVFGNNLTRSNIILRELSMKKGDVVNEVYLPKIIERDERKLFNLSLFNTVEIRVVDAGDDHIDLLVEVDERWYFFPQPIFKLSDRNFNEWWENYNHDLSRVNYGIRARHFNMRGRRENLLFTAQFGFEKKFELVYQIPYINKKQKSGLIFSMDFIRAKSIADSTVDHKLNFIKDDQILRSTRGIGLTYTYRNNFYVLHKLRYEYRNTTIADTVEILNPNYLGGEKDQQQYDALTYEFSTDHRDVAAYPLKGYMLFTSLQQNGVFLRKDLTKTQAIVSFSAFVDLKHNNYLSNLTYVHISSPNQIPYYNYSAMGYGKYFTRGYEVYVIEGPRYFLNKTTFKKKIFSRTWRLMDSPIEQFSYFPLSIYIKAYADAGYVENYTPYKSINENTRLANTWLGGAGFGIDFVSSYDTVFRIEYTFTSQNTQGLFLHVRKEF